MTLPTWPDVLTAWVPGIPVTQGSKRHVGNGVMIESSKNLRPWRDSITYAAREQGLGGLKADGSIQLGSTFYLPKPPSVKRDTPTVKPDIDKLLRAIMDALTTAETWADDARVTRIVSEKVYAQEQGPGVLITVCFRRPTAAPPLLSPHD